MSDIDQLLARETMRLHRAGSYGSLCTYCGQSWPCDAAALRDALRAEREAWGVRWQEQFQRAEDAEAEIETARAVIRDAVANSEVVSSDPRVDYVELRVRRSAWQNLLGEAQARSDNAERALLDSIEDAPREPAGDGQPTEDR